MFDALIVFLKEFLKKLILKKSQQMTTKSWKITENAKSQALDNSGQLRKKWSLLILLLRMCN